jgi:hypothetical protein
MYGRPLACPARYSVHVKQRVVVASLDLLKGILLGSIAFPRRPIMSSRCSTAFQAGRPRSSTLLLTESCYQIAHRMSVACTAGVQLVVRQAWGTVYYAVSLGKGIDTLLLPATESCYWQREVVAVGGSTSP